MKAGNLCYNQATTGLKMLVLLPYLKLFHFLLHGNTINSINANGHTAKILLCCVQPVRKSTEDAMGFFNASHLHFKLFDCLLYDKIQSHMNYTVCTACVCAYSGA